MLVRLGRELVWSVATLWALAALVAVWVAWIEPRALFVREETVELDGLERPMSVLLVGDVQPAGPHETPARLRRMMDRLARTEPDLVVWVGDYVSERRLKTSFTHPRDTARAMARIEAPLGHLAVLGNHDWWWDGGAMQAELEAVGIEVLRDEHRTLPGGLRVVGVEDPITQQPDLTRALQGVPATAPTLLLTHTPDLFPDVPEHVDLTVAGHTHCGQVSLPFLGRLVVPSRFGQRFAAGWHGVDGHRLRVTCGIGTAIVPVRLGNPPEAVLLHLRPRHDAPLASRP
jgi:hypothetical protein